MRRRISWVVLVVTSTVVVSFVVPLCLLVRTLAEDRAMATVDQDAGNVAILVAGGLGDETLAEVVETLNQTGSVAVTIYTTDGETIGAPGPDFADEEVQRARSGESVTVVTEESGRVLLPVVTAAGTTVVRASVTEDVLREGVVRAWFGIIGLGLLLLAIAAVIAADLGRRISEPLKEVAGVAHRLREGDLSVRAEPRGTTETEELARALNGLAERTGELLVAERAAVGDLGHRLRTPVTALRLDAEAVGDPALRERLAEHIGVLQHSIDAIVHEARRPVRRDLAETCEAAAVVRGRVAFWSALADDQHRPVAVNIAAEPIEVPLAQDDLGDVVDILIDNVFAHTTEPAGFSVSVTRDADRMCLVVTDTGPGPRDVRERREGSTGLGLDIARRAATAAGGTLAFGPGHDGGTRVEVRLPVVTS